MARHGGTELRIVAAEACGAVFGQTGTDRVGWYACPWLTLFATEWSAARKNPMRAAALHFSARFCRRQGAQDFDERPPKISVRKFSKRART